MTMGILERTRLERIAFADADETALVENDLADCIVVVVERVCLWMASGEFFSVLSLITLLALSVDFT